MNVKFAWAALALAGCSSAATPLPEVPPTPASTLSQWQQPPPVAPEPDVTLDMAIRRVTFDNKLSLTVVTRGDSKTTSLQLWVPSAGDRSEGRVAVMTDALRAGTRVDAKTVLVNPKLAYEPIGMGTAGSGTLFSWQVLGRASEPALRLLGNFVFHPVFEPQATQERLQAAMTTIRGNSGNQGHLANIARSALPGLEKIPTPEQDARGLLKLTPDALAKIHRCVMSPAGAELVVASALRFDQVEPWARAAFGSVPVPAADPSCGDLSVAPLDPASVQADQIQLAIVYGGAFDPVVMMSLPGPPPTSPDYVAFALLAEVLEARDVGSAQELRHMGATYGIHFSLNGSFPGVTLLEVQGQIEPDNVQAAVRQVIEDIRSVAQTITPAQLDEVKRRWRNGYIGMLSSNASVASAALSQIRRGRGPETLASWPNELMQISIEQCRATAQKWLSSAQPSIAVAGLPGKLARGLNLDARVRALQWTYDLQEQRKL
jgi:predicted Zn-dependent peptidase